MRIITGTVFHRIQKLYCAPVIVTYWNSILDQNIYLFKDKSTVCAGGTHAYSSNINNIFFSYQNDDDPKTLMQISYHFRVYNLQ